MAKKKVYSIKDPVYKDPNGKWYFWDETWSGKFGPFETEEKARTRMDEYCSYIDGCGYN